MYISISHKFIQCIVCHNFVHNTVQTEFLFTMSGRELLLAYNYPKRTKFYLCMELNFIL